MSLLLRSTKSENQTQTVQQSFLRNGLLDFVFFLLLHIYSDIFKQTFTLSHSINLPYLNAGIQLERNAVYTKLQAKVGLVVMWNGDDAVMVRQK